VDRLAQIFARPIGQPEIQDRDIGAAARELPIRRLDGRGASYIVSVARERPCNELQELFVIVDRQN
jgi:hypothetical protein